MSSEGLQLATMRRGSIAFDTALVALQQAPWHLDMPTIVLIRDMVPAEEQPPEWSPEREARLLTTWREVQTDLARRSQQGRLVVAEASGHNIHRYRPDLIVEAIREVVTSARRQRDSVKGQGKS